MRAQRHAVPPHQNPLRLDLSHRTTLPLEQCPYHQAQFSGQLSLACSRGWRVSAQHKQATPRERFQVPRCQVPQRPTDPVANDRRPDRAAHDEADPRRLIASPAHEQVSGQQRSPGPAAVADRSGEIPAMTHPHAGGQHRISPPGLRHSRAQTLTRARPLRRRAARIARPARVRMRSRNPCVFARRRLFGWNVRLLTETPDTRHRSSGANHQASPPRRDQPLGQG